MSKLPTFVSFYLALISELFITNSLYYNVFSDLLIYSADFFLFYYFSPYFVSLLLISINF